MIIISTSRALISFNEHVKASLVEAVKDKEILRFELDSESKLINRHHGYLLSVKVS